MIIWQLQSTFTNFFHAIDEIWVQQIYFNPYKTVVEEWAELVGVGEGVEDPKY